MAQPSPVRMNACVLAVAAICVPLADAKGVEQSTEQTLVPHRAVYDISLQRVDPGAAVVSASGRLVFELSGGECEGYVVNLRFVTRMTDREGNAQITDVRSATFETIEPAELTFRNRTYVDDALQNEVKGIATARTGGTHVSLTEPKESEIELSRAIFPTAHTLLILEAAAAGERVQEAVIYDGGDDADVVFDTTTVIGEGKTGLANALPQEREALSQIEDAEALTAWRLVLSYFRSNGDPGERLPDQELSFSLLENGISYNATFDYGSFALQAALSELELSDPIPC